LLKKLQATGMRGKKEKKPWSWILAIELISQKKNLPGMVAGDIFTSGFYHILTSLFHQVKDYRKILRIGHSCKGQCHH
jgi:hypothetical protein